LADVVVRFRRAIQTIGKIEKLSKIEPSDCKFFDDLMTKYSKFEHSQPLELPTDLPQPDELETDIRSLLEWRDKFLKGGDKGMASKQEYNTATKTKMGTTIA
jgi:hypothetical protein